MGCALCARSTSKDDEVLISVLEHHANVVPWQQVCQKTGAKLVYVYLKDRQLDMDDLRSKLSTKTKFVSIAHVSNVLGSIQPVKEIAKLAHQVGAYMVVDGAQSAPHMTIDVQDLDCDFLHFQGTRCLGLRVLVFFTVKKNFLIKCHLLNLVVK